MNTFILMWNPAISSVNEALMNTLIQAPLSEFNWSIWDHEKAEDGDRFFLVRVGEGNTGIVMAGNICGDPWRDQDWSGRGREVYYVWLNIETFINSAEAPVIDTATLEQAFPNFGWSGGHSGRMLPPEFAQPLEEMWKQYKEQNAGIFDRKRAVSIEYI